MEGDTVPELISEIRATGLTEEFADVLAHYETMIEAEEKYAEARKVFLADVAAYEDWKVSQ